MIQESFGEDHPVTNLHPLREVVVENVDDRTLLKKFDRLLPTNHFFPFRLGQRHEMLLLTLKPNKGGSKVVTASESWAYCSLRTLETSRRRYTSKG